MDGFLHDNDPNGISLPRFLYCKDARISFINFPSIFFPALS